MAGRMRGWDDAATNGGLPRKGMEKGEMAITHSSDALKLAAAHCIAMRGAPAFWACLR